MKVTIYILDRSLRADGLKIAVFRQTASNEGWADAPVNADTVDQARRRDPDARARASTCDRGKAS